MPLQLVYPRQTALSVSLNGDILPAISASVTAGFDRKYLEAEIDLPVIPANSQSLYYTPVNIVMGAGQMITRFRGLLVDYAGELYPNVHRLICKGRYYMAYRTFNPNVLEPDLHSNAPG